MNMPSRLILSVGMPRAGSGWHYNLTHDLIVASGGRDAHQVRTRYHLQRILTAVNCNIGALTTRRITLAMLPVLFGNTYTIKAHAAPKRLTLALIHRGFVHAVYIYRDPRDALLSAYEYGQRGLHQGRSNAFSILTTIEKAIDFMQEYVRISEAWLRCVDVLHVRYEDLLMDYDAEAARLIHFLHLNVEELALREVLDQHRPQQGQPGRAWMHFVQGKIGRFRQKLTSEQKEQCLHLFGTYLKERGYPLS